MAKIDYFKLKKGLRERVECSLNALEVVATKLSDPLIHGEYVTRYLKTREDAMKEGGLRGRELEGFDTRARGFMLQFYSRMVKLIGEEQNEK